MWIQEIKSMMPKRCGSKWPSYSVPKKMYPLDLHSLCCARPPRTALHIIVNLTVWYETKMFLFLTVYVTLSCFTLCFFFVFVFLFFFWSSAQIWPGYGSLSSNLLFLPTCSSTSIVLVVWQYRYIKNGLDKGNMVL